MATPLHMSTIESTDASHKVKEGSLTRIIILLKLGIDTPYKIHKQAPRIFTDSLALFLLEFDPLIKMRLCEVGWSISGR